MTATATDKKKLLLVGDFCAATGFANVNEPLAEELAALGWDVVVLAIQYHGDPHPLARRYRVYPAITGGDHLGLARLAAVVRVERPDAILIVNDPPVVDQYLEELGDTAPPVVAYMPVDAPRMNPRLLTHLDRLAHAVAYTQFGADELRRAGYAGPLSIAPHGVDLALFQPGEKAEARRRAGLDPRAFAVLVVDRNAPRKRLDLAFAAFAQFAREVPEAHLIYHGALNDVGWDLEDLARQHSIPLGRWAVTNEHMTAMRGIPRHQLPTVYQLADVKLSTAMGEGWGLTTMEAMACGIPCVAVDCAAIGEWARGAALLVEPDPELAHTYAGGVNTRGAVARPSAIAAALGALYADPGLRDELGRAGRDLVRQERFRWPVIAQTFDAVLSGVAGKAVTV